MASKRPHFSHHIVAFAALFVLVVITSTYTIARYAPAPMAFFAQKAIEEVTLRAPKTTGIDGVSLLTKNIPYCGTKNVKQVLDLYRPRQGVTRPIPLVVYVHGGGWRSGDKRNAVLANYGPGILRSGFAIASVNYRLAPGSLYPAQPNDVSCALGYLRKHATQNGIETSRMTLMGDSAGGQLVALEALKLQDPRSIASVVDLYGVNDVVAQLNASPRVSRNTLSYLGSKNQTLASTASPLTYANTRSAPPFLLINGVDDHVVNINESRAFATALRKAGTPVTLVEVKHAGHAFGTASGGKPSVSELSEQIDSFITSAQNKPI